MKILFYHIVDLNDYNNPKRISDYLSDTLFHGFRSLFGEDFVDNHKLIHMYKSYDKKSELYGKGFTVFGKLDDIEIDRTDIDSKIKNQYFDYIIAPIHCAQQHNFEFQEKELGYLTSHYPCDKIAIIDGNDNPIYNENLPKYGFFFKRECINLNNKIPILFSIPKEIIVDDIPNKNKDFASLIPGVKHNLSHPHFRTYVYNDEEFYYQDYRNSYFGYTCKKEGWDCIRHYEIIACGCVPFFLDIEKCPLSIMTNYPKEMCVNAKKIKGIHAGETNNSYHPPKKTYIGGSQFIHPGGGHIDHDIFESEKYFDIANKLLKYTKKNLTTESLAKYVLEKLND